METKIETICIPETEEVSGILFRRISGESLWAWGNYETGMGVNRLSGINVESCGERWFAFYQEDCFDPCVYAVLGKSWEDAYEEFCEWKLEDLRIPEDQLKDYKCAASDELDCHYSSGGIPIDASLVCGFEIEPIEIRLRGYSPSSNK